MKINALNSLLIGGLLTGASIALAGCDSTFAKASKYMREHNYTQKEYEEMLYKNSQYPKDLQNVVMQSTLDSMVYRDLLNATQLVGDSSIVADFNALAGRTNVSNINIKEGTFNPNDKRISKMLKDEGVTISEYESVMNGEALESVRQHNADRLLYSKFFKKYGLISKDFQTKFDSVSRLAKPY